MGIIFFSTRNTNMQETTFVFVLCLIVLVMFCWKRSQQNSLHITTKRQRLFNQSDFSSSLNKSGKLFWSSLKPSLQCPDNLQELIGNSGGGGKWVCGLSQLELLHESKNRFNHQNLYEPCLAYSFGVNHDSSWEAQVLATTHCVVYAYDPTVNSIATPLKPSNKRVHFTKLGLAGRNEGDKRTLATLMKMNGHENSLIHILKVDIEGWEYPALENILNDFPDELPFAQLLVEFHVWDWAVSKEKAQRIVNLFSGLENRGVRLFHVDNYGVNEKTLNKCSEFSFINVKYLDLFGIE